MTTRRGFLVGGSMLGAVMGSRISTAESTSPRDERAAWVTHLKRVAEPVLTHWAAGTLQSAMPVEAAPGHVETQRPGTHLEAVGRLLCGIAPWLELEDESNAGEAALRVRFRALSKEGIARGVEKSSPTYLKFGATAQTLVDSSFLALALLRAPKHLMGAMDASTRTNFVEALVAARVVKPGMNNWLLFAAMNEACLFTLGHEWKREVVEFGLDKHRGWYLGDGTFGDGPHLHWDYYNSFVIQPYLLQIFETLGAELPAFAEFAAEEKKHAVRYATVQERLISVDGSYPAVGRSIAYRCGAFHLLADVARRGMLPTEIAPNQVRCALSAVIERTLGARGTFDEAGWLRIGLAGHQPGLGETYISTGSLYLCSFAFLPLGLAAGDVFWSGPRVRWSAQRIWSGESVLADHAQD
ncbi:DUF2264 domain-containing protein [Terriglobus saanensis]|uniref:DUF2264 domain-containing protein n=1 Tax=Terriglobus saanensis (strain ATCC BAA-1853 / DSM 23119 / SP1PR4) TaxID=401053 RepID=E8V3X5_TERSS|nr:DUF2264 domain-containing protein [Terriglobus saanensis]ADV81389.1 hypothetical protein AciPR4_0554 [Terriglobus saanensis SP1PR4]